MALVHGRSSAWHRWSSVLTCGLIAAWTTSASARDAPTLSDAATDSTAAATTDGTAAATTDASTSATDASGSPTSSVTPATTSSKRRFVPPFYLDFPTPTHRTRALTLPPLFLHRTPTAGHPERFLHADLGLTFGWYSTKLRKRRFVNPAILMAGSFSERTSVWGVVPLLMGYKRVGEQFRFGQFPLIWWWGNKHVKNFFILPVHYHQNAPEGRNGVTAGIFWYGHKNLNDADLANDRKHFVAAPVFWRFGVGQRTLDVSPLYVGGRDKIRGVTHRTVFPFVHHQTREFGNRRELWTLPFVRRTDRARGRHAWAIPPLLTFGIRSPERSFLAATPLFVRSRNFHEGRQFTLVGPVGHYRDRRQSSHFVAPLWWHTKSLSTGATTSLLFPFAFARRTPDTRAVWTLLGGGSRSRDGSFSAGIPWLFHCRFDSGNAASQRATRPSTTAPLDTSSEGCAALLGLIWYRKGPAHEGTGRSRTLALSPFMYDHRSDTSHRFGSPLLLSFFGRTKLRNYDVVTPLVWHVRDTVPGGFRRTVVAGPVFGQRKPDGWRFGVAPLLFAGKARDGHHVVLPPLLFADVRTKTARTSVAPLVFRHQQGNDRTWGVLPLVFGVRRPDEHHFVAAPFVYRRRIGNEHLLLSPLGGYRRRGDERTYVVGPAYARVSPTAKSGGFFPLAFHDDRTTKGTDGRLARSTHTGIFPVFLRRRTPTDDLDIFSPLVWRSRFRGPGKPRDGLAVVPFYFRQRQPGGVDVDAGAGFFYSRDRIRHTHTIIAGPAFHRLSRTELNAGVAPLYWWHDSMKARRLFALPGIVHVADKTRRSHTTVAVPFWFDRLQQNGRRTWAAFPFVIGLSRRTHNFARFGLAVPLYYDVFRLEKNTRFTAFLPFYFRHQRCGYQVGDDPSCRYTVTGSFPFFLYGKDGKGRHTHGSILHYFDRDAKGYRFRSWLFGFTRRPGDDESATYFLPVFHKRTKTHRRTLVFPVFYHRAHRLHRQSTTAVLPPLYVSRTERDRRFLTAGLLYWQVRYPHKVQTAIVPPLFFHSHTFAERKLTWFLPVFVRDAKMAGDRNFTAVFPGLYFQRRRGNDLDAVQFPLVWHFERGQNRGTFGAFVWWDIRHKGNVTQVVPGLYTRRATKARDVRILGPGLAWWTRGQGAKSGDLHWRALFGLFGGGRVGGARYVSLFGAQIPLRPRASGRPVKPAPAKPGPASPQLTSPQPVKPTPASLPASGPAPAKPTPGPGR